MKIRVNDTRCRHHGRTYRVETVERLGFVSPGFQGKRRAERWGAEPTSQPHTYSAECFIVDSPDGRFAVPRACAVEIAEGA